LHEHAAKVPGTAMPGSRHSVRAKGRETQRSDCGIVSIDTAIGLVLVMARAYTTRLLQTQSRLLQQGQNTFAEVRKVGKEIEETKLHPVYA
jgi:hypothetical protein